ncbi:hypothetical protein ACFFX1_50640 [Dactylosporangium sucinum]|uniref:Uncharacterized protein n=1 Tax=Dactylosporangium sucinum TaxID=1424081 RepID=A0A917X1W3_9ACTN|nr:hypothetical protein [Dactylosporangium sucinum]GGM53972.1 hypothetical protein GCM10007977_064430 [Dactylosporangium sucinum]
MIDFDGLVPAHFGDGEAARSRKHLRKVLAAAGLSLRGGKPAAPDDRPHVLIVHTSDYAYASRVYAVPDEAVTPALRTALGRVPACFAAPDDARLRVWGDVLRLMAVLGLDGLSAADFHNVMVEDFGAQHGHRDLPDLAELTELGNAWSPYAVAEVDHLDDSTTTDGTAAWLGHHYVSMYAFRQSM